MKPSCDDRPLWVVTSYFNPEKYTQRYKNFQTFRRFLNAPLLVVELDRNGDFALMPSDADIVIQLTGEDRLWQKERLLNIGIDHLTTDVEYVAWIDCDVVFGRDDWAQQTMSYLDQHGGLVQLFETAHHLGPTAASAPPASYTELVNEEVFFSQKTFASIADDRDAYFAAKYDFVSPSTASFANKGPVRKSPISHGMAWAARRPEIAACGLYDRGILGHGDSMLTSSLLGWSDTLLDMEYFGVSLRDDMMAWADHLRAHITPQIGSIDGVLYHLWHGDFENRKYRDRHKIMLDNQFDPARDLLQSENGTWAWADPTSALAQDVAAYFAGRREDG